MKKLSLVLIVFCSIFVGQQCYAQKQSVPKELLLSTLNSVGSLKKLSNLKADELMKYNEGFVDKVYVLIEGDKTAGDKKKAFKTLSDDKERDLKDLLGKKMYKKYTKLMEVEMEPLIKRTKDLKFLYN